MTSGRLALDGEQAAVRATAMVEMPEIYRVGLSPFRATSSGIHSVVMDLVPKGFLPQQLCLIGTQPAIAPVASAIDPKSAIYPHVSELVTNVEGVYAPHVSVPLVASAGPILDVLLKKQSWLSSAAAAPLHHHLDKGDVVLAVNGLDHNQFVDATRLLLRHGDGNVLTHMFRWP